MMSEAEPANSQPPDIAGAEQQETATAIPSPPENVPTRQQEQKSPSHELQSSTNDSHEPPSQQSQQPAESLQNSAPCGSTPPPKNSPSTQSNDQPYPSAQPIQASIGSPLPSNMPPMPSVGQYIPGATQTSIAPNSQTRYHIPGDPSKMVSSGRHKKEVKRRTKTGCLTCRKRRIKCDEAHPVCRNCVKSKRECLGYDPVFRPQLAPSTIQPAQNHSPSLVVPPQEPPSHPPAPLGYVAAVTQSLSSSVQSDSPTPPVEQRNYGSGSTIDPVLEGNSLSAMASVQNTLDRSLHQPAGAPSGAATPASETSALKEKHVKINDLLALTGIPPPPPLPISPIQQSRVNEIQAVFLTTYAPAIDKFLETRWFQEKGLALLLRNPQLMTQYSGLIDAFNNQDVNNPVLLGRTESFEASVVWDSMTLCRSAMTLSNGNAGNTQDPDLLAAVKRLEAFEALVTGEHLETNPLAQLSIREPLTKPPTLTEQLQQRMVDFWNSIGHFLTLYDDEASSAKEIDDTLARARTLLDTYENRDVVYSIAIARHIGQRWAAFPHSVPQPVTTDEKDPGAKLYVAQKFLEQEAGGKGTTQVIKRICGMVVRSWTVFRQWRP